VVGLFEFFTFVIAKMHFELKRDTMRAKLLILGGTCISGITYAGGFQANFLTRSETDWNGGHAGVGLAWISQHFFNPGRLGAQAKWGTGRSKSVNWVKTATQEPGAR